MHAESLARQVQTQEVRDGALVLDHEDDAAGGFRSHPLRVSDDCPS